MLAYASELQGQNAVVPSLLIRNVDAALHARLKAHATKHRRSLEEDARELLRAALAQRAAGPGENIVDIASRLFGTRHGVELDIPPRSREPGRRPPDFDDPEFGL